MKRKRREFLTSMCGLGVAALAPWALLAESPVKWRRIENTIPTEVRWRNFTPYTDVTSVIPFDYDLHRFGDSDGFGDGLWGEA